MPMYDDLFRRKSNRAGKMVNFVQNGKITMKKMHIIKATSLEIENYIYYLLLSRSKNMDLMVWHFAVRKHELLIFNSQIYKS